MMLTHHVAYIEQRTPENQASADLLTVYSLHSQQEGQER